jgi:hypothetical protein
MRADRARRRWARRVSPDKIRMLYESDARGMVDVDLLDDVGYGIYVRCRDLLEVSEAWRGRVKCWACGSIVLRRQGTIVEYSGHGATRISGKDEVLTCDQCGWRISWGDYCKSTAGKGLNATGLEDVFGVFVERWPSIRSPHARLLLIDRLIHEFHCWDGNTIGSPVGAAVIRATPEEALALLDELAYGSESTRGLQEARQQWASRLAVKKRQHPLSELQAIARELGVKGRSRMRRAELQKAIERIAPERLHWSAIRPPG